ncbi:MAG: Hsp20/alpha crystallin family protein [Candidatus Kerfeldbacteria bacterium]|nr:Hsp20/alpha crystallin family protein [Candidatus Kerfeldbacteria bacterium]
MAIIPYRSVWPDLDDFFGGFDLMNFTPAVNIYEDKDHVMVETPLAGIDPDKVDIEIEDNVLKISGSTESKSEVDDKDKHYYRKEIRSGSFYRAVALPKAVDGSKAEAHYSKGILKISIPKKEEAKPRSIKVKATE